MRRIFRLAAGFLGVLLAVGAAGCGEQAPGAAAGSAPSQAASASQAAPPSAAQGASSPAPASRADAITPGGASSAAPSSALEDAFAQKWAKNPLDAAYDAASGSAETTQAMTELANRYAVQWESAVVDAYQKLRKASGDDAALKAEQEAWASGKEAALQQIRDSQAGNGTAGSLAAAAATLDFYRSRARQLYQELFQYDPDFTFDQTN